ncbi:MAG: amino acid ABC transporter ATP-binding protein, partial [Lachnospiraceae bacterium]|nr:amino acid ABC transporter ATP-binding protein [Lachnospiraceae bacterium]
MSDKQDEIKSGTAAAEQPLRRKQDDKRVIIRIEHLKKYYRDHTIHAIDDVSLSIRTGEVVCIIGPSGSGKSTLLRSMNLLEMPTDGHIFVDDVDITDPKIDIDKHRQKMGMVFQHFNLFPNMTVLRNMTI